MSDVRGTTAKQRSVLRVIHDSGNYGYNSSYIALRLGRTTNAVYKSLLRLEKRGLVWRPDYDTWHITNPGIGAL